VEALALGRRVEEGNSAVNRGIDNAGEKLMRLEVSPAERILEEIFSTQAACVGMFSTASSWG